MTTTEQRLSAGEGDVLEVRWAEGADLQAMQSGCHFDYQTQTWQDGHDHAHYLEDRGPLFFCGSDLQTCQG